jgi:DNA modification methylase
MQAIWGDLPKTKQEVHTAPFCVELPERIVKLHTHIDEIVIEPFAGSGTTAIACEKLNRRCYMMEIDEHYCDVIIQRWQNFTGKEAMRIDG